MGTMSTFGSFGIARLGIYASQKAMQVTGNNITNVNTPGYTRQELQLQSLYVGGADRYSSRYDMKIGSGVLSTGVQQIRSPYLDIRYRTEMSNVGARDTTLSVLNQLNIIFDEVGDGEGDEGIMEAALQGLIEQLEYYSSEGAGRDSFDSIVRGEMKEIVSLFNDYAARLEKLYKNQVTNFRSDVDRVNTILTEIQKLNNSIRKAEIHGSNALELKDDRNVLIDELSKYIRIDVLYEAEDVGAGILVDKLVIKLDSNDPDSPNDGAILIDGKFASQLKIPDLDESDEALLDTVHQFNVTLDTLKDINGEPHVNNGYYQSGKYTPLANEGTITIAGYSVPSGDPPGGLEQQLKTFVDAFNNDPANSGWKAEVQYEDDGTTPTGYIEFVQRKAGDTATVTPKVAADGTITINGFTFKADPADTLADQAAAFAAAYNADENNTTWKAAADANGNITFTLTDEGAAEVPPMLPGTKLVIDQSMPGIPYPVVNLTDNDLYGSLQSSREMLTEKGQFADDADVAVDPNATTKNGIPYYRKVWDAMAIQFAAQLNKANTMVDSNGKLITENGEYVISPANYYQKDDEGFYTDSEKNQLILIEDTANKEYNLFSKTAAEAELSKMFNNTPVKLGADGSIYENDPNADPDAEPKLLGKLASDGTITQADGTDNGAKIGSLSVDGTMTPVSGGTASTLTPAELKNVVAREQYVGGVLLSNSGDGDDTTGITAKNIAISHSWSEEHIKILKSRTDSELDQSSQNSNLLHMVSILRDNKYDYCPGMTDPEWNDGAGDPNDPGTWGSPYFTGSFAELLTKIDSGLAEDTRTTSARLSDALSTQNELEMDRSSVSGVDLNDEAISMMQFNKSYSAACRLMTTLDQMLDKLINGTAV